MRHFDPSVVKVPLLDSPSPNLDIVCLDIVFDLFDLLDFNVFGRLLQDLTVPLLTRRGTLDLPLLSNQLLCSRVLAGGADDLHARVPPDLSAHEGTSMASVARLAALYLLPSSLLAGLSPVSLGRAVLVRNIATEQQKLSLLKTPRLHFD